MQELAFKTYLIGQCSKLAQPAELDAYVNGACHRQPLHAEFWDILRHSPHIGSTSAFAKAEYANEFFSGMSLDILARLTEAFSVHHKNGVYRRVTENRFWEEQEVSMERLDVEYMESELKPAIRRHRHSLMALAQDAEILTHQHYKDRDLRQPVPYDVFLAIWKNERPRLIDGNHRAIHKARQFLAGHLASQCIKVVVPSR